VALQVAVDAPEDAPAVSPAKVGGWRDWWPATRYALTVFLCVRIGLLIVGLLSVALLPSNKGTDVPGWPAHQVTGGWHNMFTAWERYDALWYLRIASTGYRGDDGSAAFFPLYPLLTRAVAYPLGHRWLLAAYLVSNLALVAALILLHRLTELELGEVAARRAVLYICIFPTGFFLFAPYTESLFLALSVGCLYAARRSQWLLAGALGALASSTRSAGIVLALPLLVEGFLQLRAQPEGRLRRAAAAVGAAALVPVGMVLYLGYWAQYGGDWRRPLDIQKSGWGKEFSTPWHTLHRGWETGTQFIGSYPGGYHTLDLLVVVVVLGASIWTVFRLRPTYSVYVFLSLIPPLLLMYDGRPLISVPRYYLVAFPVFWAFGRFAERWRAHDLIVAGSAIGAGVMSILYINWYYIF
jgi:hypothetical protein